MMHFLTVLIALTAALMAGVKGECSTNTAFEIAGNWYCDSVDAIQYSHVGFPGSYSRVTGMVIPESGSGFCTSEKVPFSGPLSPLDEEVSLHFRGPISLKQFAVYSIVADALVSSAVSQSSGSNAIQQERRNQMHHHSHNARQATDTSDVTVTSIVTTVIEVTSTIFACPSETRVVHISSDDNGTNNDEPLNPATFANGEYVRTGYYNSVNGTAENLTFIGNYGGAGSGVFDDSFGASTAYLNSEGSGGAAAPEILMDTTIPSSKEFAIFSGVQCKENDSCGFSRPGSVAYHGFPGADKLFLFEFQMPIDGGAGFEGNMPALWMLNAQIPRTVQYGPAGCSCWPLCGEFDIMETLSPGSMYCTSTLHTNTPAGDSDYIERPTEATMKLAVLFHAQTSGIRIQVMPENQDFREVLTPQDMDEIMKVNSPGMMSEVQVAS